LIPPARVRLTVAYDGTDFSGFAPNRGVRTVGATLGDALETVLGERVTLTCAGRTDRGVHAWGQVVTFDTAFDRLDPDRLGRSLRSMCGPEIVVRDVAVVPATFDARFSARWRRYRYTVLNDEATPPWLDRYVWRVPGPLSMPALEQGATAVIGPHDFSAFCRCPPPRFDGSIPTRERTVLEAGWTAQRDASGTRLLVFEIRAGAFCHQMVRSIVGLLIDVGRGRCGAAEVRAALASTDRNALPPAAPPSGLCLWEVGYPEVGEPPDADVA
jgi:tRNA pseudouridine38-40 synthase